MEADKIHSEHPDFKKHSFVPVGYRRAGYMKAEVCRQGIEWDKAEEMYFVLWYVI